MQNSPTWTPVVAGLLIADDGRVLIQKRPAGKPHSGLWEFPGGKVEIEENHKDALVRELKEELAIEVRRDSLEPLTFAEDLPGNAVVLFLYKVTDWSCDPVSTQGAEIAWTPVSGLDAYEMPPLDVQLRSRVAAMSIAGVL